MRKFKMSSLKKYISICVGLAIVFVSSVFTVPSAQASPDELAASRNYLCSDLFGKVKTVMNIGDDVEDMPADYAGVYIDQNNNLKICVTTGNVARYEDKINSCDTSELINSRGIFSASQKAEMQENIIEVVEKTFSYQQLYNVYDIVSDNMSKFKAIEAGISSEDNRVNITLHDLSDKDTVNNFLYNHVQNFDERMVYYEVGEVVESTSVAYNGVKFYWATLASSYGTLGYNAAYTDSSGRRHYGVVTNAHVAPLGKDMKIGAISTVGKSIISTYSDTIDASFVEFNNSSWTCTTRILNSSGRSIYCVSPSTDWIENAMIQKFGATSGTRSGTITYPTTTVTVQYNDGVTREFRDVVRFSNYTAGGDSGGPVVRIENNQTRLLGITFAGNSEGANYGYGIKHYNISNELGINAYTELGQW